MRTTTPTLLKKSRDFLSQGGWAARVERLRNFAELRRQAVRLASHPSILYLEPGTICNLRCPFCPTGNGELRLAKELLSLENFGRIMSHIRVEYLTRAHLYNWGEPLLNPHLNEFIRFFSARNIHTTVSTNFSVKDYDEAFLAELAQSGLEELLVSVDGATQATYERYRVRGDLGRVIRNMKLLAEVKAREGVSRPRVQLRMLLNRHNEPEIEAAARLAESVGATFVLNENFFVPSDRREEWEAESVRRRFGDVPPTIYGRRRRSVIHTECRQMWDTLVVNSNGDVFPCCIVHEPASALGNLIEQDVEEIRNNLRSRTLRRFVTDAGTPAPDFPNSCDGCPNRYCTHRGL